MATIGRRINLRHFMEKRLRTALTISGIAAGVALMFSIAVINDTLLGTFRASVRDLAGAAEIEVAAPDQTGLPEKTVARVASVDGVRRAVPALRATTQLSRSGAAERAMVLGVTPEFSSLFPENLGRLARVRITGGFGPGGDGIVLSRTVADRLGVREGDSLRVQTPSGVRTTEVTGAIGGGAIAALNGGDVGIMLLPAAQDLFDKQGVIDSIYVVVDADVPVASVDEAIERELEGAAVVGPPGTRSRGLERIFAALGRLLSLAGTVSLFVALFVVYNTMSMSLAERRREISMALALGASRRHVFGAFLAEAAVLGTVASAVGIGLGLMLADVLLERAVESYSFLPLSGASALKITAAQIATAMAGGIAVSLAGAFVPARRVLSVAPIEALRPEAAYEWARTSRSRAGRRATLVGGVIGLALAAGLFAAFLGDPELEWAPTAGIVAGLTGITFFLPHIVPRALAVLRPVYRRAFGPMGRLSADALAKNPGRTTFTVAALVLTLGVALGVGSALASYQTQVENLASTLIGAPIYVTSESYTGLSSDQPLPASLRDDLAAVEGVEFVYPLRFSLINVEGGQAHLNAIPVQEALTAGATTELSAITEDPDAFLGGLERGAVAVSRLTARRHGLDIGDSFALPTPAGRRDFQVAAVYEDLLELDSLYIDYETYVRLWNDDKADEFGIILTEDADVSRVQAALAGAVEERGVAAEVLSAEELIGRILDTVEGSFALGRGIQLAALIVAALVVANTMFTAVFERRWEMGLQRALGMNGSEMARSVLLEAAGIGIVGGVGGAALGTLIGFLMVEAMEAQFAWRIGFALPWTLIGFALLGGLVVAALAGSIPSRLAVRTNIIESLRYE